MKETAKRVILTTRVHNLKKVIKIQNKIYTDKLHNKCVFINILDLTI